MSTPNFNRLSLRNIYAYNNDEAEDTPDNVFYDLKSMKSIDIKKVSERSRFSGRSYPVMIFSEINMKYKNESYYINLLNCGAYYEGGSLDVSVQISGEELNLKEFNSEYPKIANSKEFRDMIKRIERVYKRYTIKLNLKGVFSNGEAVYEKAK